MASAGIGKMNAYFVAPVPSTQATTAPVIEASTVAAKMSTATAFRVVILVVPYMVKSIAPATKKPTQAPDLAHAAAVLTCPTQEKIYERKKLYNKLPKPIDQNNISTRFTPKAKPAFSSM